MKYNNYIQGFRIDWNSVPEDSYIKTIESIRKIDEFRFDSPITFFAGENGSGKSSLLEAIAESYGFNKEGGSKNYNFSTYDEPSDLAPAITIYKGYSKANYNYFFRAETFFNVATKEIDYSISSNPNVESQRYHERSHGESFLHLFKNLCEAKGVFILDEPEAALSPDKQLTLFSLIYDASKNGSQFIIATHSPILLAIPNADIYSFTNEGLIKCKYEDTESYKIISNFINHKDIMVNELIK